METSKLRAMVMRDGNFSGIMIIDLVKISNIPYAVFEWDTVNGEKQPLYKVRLDPRALVELPPAPGSDLKYQYNISVEDPRPLE